MHVNVVHYPQIDQCCRFYTICHFWELHRCLCLPGSVVLMAIGFGAALFLVLVIPVTFVCVRLHRKRHTPDPGMCGVYYNKFITKRERKMHFTLFRALSRITFFTHMKLCLATATLNFKWVKITHICLVGDETFLIIIIDLNGDNIIDLIG